MLKYLTLALLGGAAIILASCSGGGSSAGGGEDPTAPRSVTMSADDTALPLNIGGEMASIGSPYTTTIYVTAHDSQGRPVATANFSCSINDDLPSGALYYLDGDPEHEEELDVTADTAGAVCTPDGECTLTVPLAYRAVVLETSTGTASFHYHTTNLVGTPTILCAVADSDGVVVSEDIIVQVGGATTGKVSQIVLDQISSPGYLFIQGMNTPNQAQIQANLVDESGQAIATPAGGVNNLQVRIVPDASTSAENDATLRGVNGLSQAVAGQSINVQGIVGQVQFTLVSGTHTGNILLEAISDRSDNNVDNGIAEPIYNYATVVVVDEVPTVATEVAITTTTLPAAVKGVAYGALLQASGGTVPYTWSLVTSSLPSGLNVSSSGIISGTPTSSTAGTYNFVVRVTDRLGTTVQKQFAITYTVPAVTTPTIASGALSNGTFNESYVHALTASGGTAPYSWSITPDLPTGLSLNSATGIISGTPTACVTAKNFVVTVTDQAGGTSTANKALTIAGCP